MKVIFQKWLSKPDRCFYLANYKESWKNQCGPQFFVHENGGRKRRGDRCFDLTIAAGYWCFTYTNFDLQGDWKHEI